MSIERLKMIFENLENCNNWSLQLLRIIDYARDGKIKYGARQISLNPDDKLNSFVSEIAKKYLSEGKGGLSSYVTVIPYDGSTDSLSIYKLCKPNSLIDKIKNEYQNFLKAIANPDVENNVKNYNSAYLIKGQLSIAGEEIPVKLISMQKPITTLQHKFWQQAGSYSEISGDIISLRLSIDVMIVGEDIYFFKLAAGEKLFNMPRAYKEACHKYVLQIKTADIVSDFGSFQAVAESGHNPRRFISFNESYLSSLNNANTRKKIANKFSIPITNSKFDTSISEISEKLIKILCNKGMLNPFNNEPCEVMGTKRWN